MPGDGLPRLPASMMTQHPDAATQYVSVQNEPAEAIEALTPAPEGLGLDEAMVDFEGKLTPYQQTSQIVLGLLTRGIVVGRDVFVTPRIPSGVEEGVFRQLMALMSVVESNYHAWKRTGNYAIREVILPMTSGSAELLTVRERANDVIALAHKEFGLTADPNILQLIPLIETIPQILEIKGLLSRYLDGCPKLGVRVERLRYMLGRSDLALSYGLVPAVLANKVAISDGYELAAERRVEMAPIMGGGTLPFRGHFTLSNLDNVLREYAGVRTLTLQSALRYDYGSDVTRMMAAALRARLQETAPVRITDRDRCLNFIGVFAKNYLHTFYKLMDAVGPLSDLVPKQRDRLARKGELGYPRHLPHPDQLAELVPDASLSDELRALSTPQAIELPRAISYVAAMYSIGLPPELLAAGRGLREIEQRYGVDALAAFNSIYPSLKADLAFSARFAHLENASQFVPEAVQADVAEDARWISHYMELELGPSQKDDRFYATVLETMRPMLKEMSGVGGAEGIISDESLEAKLVRDWIVKLGAMRGGLG